MLHRLQFNLWYFFRPPWDSGISPPELIQYLADHRPGRALDLGCGTGTNAITLARHAWQVTGIDFAARAIQIARRKAHSAGVAVDLSVGDVTSLHRLSGPFDLALDIGCFHGVLDRLAYLSSVERLLKPGGDWLLYAFFRPAEARRGPGLDPEALELIRSHRFVLISRSDGTDKRGRPSAWLLYQRPT